MQLILIREFRLIRRIETFRHDEWRVLARCLHYMPSGRLAIRPQAKCLHKVLQEAIFADDCVLFAHKNKDPQVIIVMFSEASKALGFGDLPSV